MLPQQKQAAALMQQQAAALQSSMYGMPPPPLHPLLAAPPPQQIEPILTGNLPPGFDTSTCRSVYVGNVHVQVTEALLREVFQSTGLVEGCKLIRKEKSSYGFVDYYDRRSAALAILTLNGRQIFGQLIRVNWAYASGQREDTTDHFSIFVGDLSPEVTDSALFSFFSGYSSCSDARVMWDQKTGRSRGYGFVSFRNQQDAQSAINDLNGQWLGSRQIRCNWATKGASSGEQTSDSKNVADLTNNLTDGKEKANEDAPENNPQYRTVYVGNLAHEVTQDVLHRLFHALGAGVIEEVRIQLGKGFGFVRYSDHAEAALAIQMGNGRILGGKPIKCSWGNKPTPPGTTSAPLPPPAAPSLTAADILEYQRTLALSKMASTQALMQAQAQQQHLKPAMGMGPGASQAMYDGSFPGVGIGASQQHQQQLMYY
ncbi:oligouridylate-binding protein 1-like isoform X2 [Oryza brachyantha]|uniref:oligouridylate-binding protein 1-like isoform X2 n=1 Tax=Oryza brachyantha TaxID=4533 RepID=UPI001AD9B845|nr:oligouridylate-binding protein 1-like isoform X2 [Oryza brachyantha]